MKILYIYPHTLAVKNGDFFHPYLKNNFERYLSISRDLTILISDEDLKVDVVDNEDNKIDNCKVIRTKSIKSIYSLAKNDVILDEISKADLIITRMPSFEGNLVVKYAKKMDKKVLIDVVGCPWDAFWNHSLKGKLIAPYMYFLTQKYVKKADFVMYVTNEFLQNRYPNNKLTIGCSDVIIDDVDFKKRKYDDFINKPTIILGSSGAIDVSYKSQDEIIKLLPELNKKYNRVEYHLAGIGDKTNLLKIAKKHKVEDKVVFLGFLDKKGVNNFLDNVDIYIQPSKTEGLPRSLIEAMSRSCICFATGVGGNTELLHSNFIYPKNSILVLKDYLLNLHIINFQKESLINYNKSLEFTRESLLNKRKSFYNLIKSIYLK